MPTTATNASVSVEAVIQTEPLAPKSDEFKPRSYSPEGVIGKRVVAYFLIKGEFDRLKVKLEHHNAFFNAHCNRNRIYRIGVGIFQIQRKARANWTYSAKLEKKMLEVKQLQREEQDKGVAKNKPTIFVSPAISRRTAKA